MFNIFNLFKRKKKNEEKKIELDDFIINDEVDNISKILNSTQEQLSLEKKDWRHLDVNYIEIFKELERQQNYLIRFEFLPKNQNFRNARSALQFHFGDYFAWKKVRDSIEEKYNFACKICGKTSQENELNKDIKHSALTECHEVWSFNEVTKIQKLEDLEALCNRCHSIKHINRHFKDIPYQNSLFKKYEEINSIDEERRLLDYSFAIDYQNKLNDIYFDMDLSFLNELNIGINFDKTFKCHTDNFNGFLEVKFKNQKDLEE